ncbi:MAG: polysaccharide biosynthesis C-terminal domain-containing protein [Bacteroidota bacterium]
MGIVKKQAFFNSIVNYLGVFIGYVNIVLLFPNVFDTQQFGLTRILIAIATIYMQFSSLGINRVLVKFFPFFKTNDNKHHGFLLLGLIIPLIGFFIITTLYIVLDDVIISKYKEQSELFLNNYYYAVPLTFLMLYCGVLEAFLQAMYRTILSNFLRSVLIRILWTGDILLYYFGYINFDIFLFLFVYLFAINLLILSIYLVVIKQFHIKPDKEYFKPRILKLIANYGLFSILSGISNIIVNRIDIIMIGFLMGLSDTAIYAVATYISALVFIPAKEINRISFPIISSDWKNKRFDKVNELYGKTSINQLLLGGFVFICIWANIENIFKVMPPEYADGRYVILFIALSRLFAIIMGVNSLIIMVSKYYRFDTIAVFILGIITIVTNLLLIPIYGIEGAAMATALSIILYHSINYLFVLAKLRMQPFNIKTLLGILVLLISLFVTDLIPQFDNYITDIIIRCIVISLIFFPLILFFKISPDINETFFKVIRRFQ